ncbi:MAG: flavin-containing monooxygenase [Acidimicrobiales bacterium]
MPSATAVSLSDADLARIVATADRRTLAAVVTHLSGDPAADVPSDEVLQRAMNVAAGEDVPVAYAPLVREQMGFGPAPEVTALRAAAGFHVAIIGGGITGILTGIMLDRMGLSSFTILETNPEVGGTWWQNRSPGCRVGTPSLLYSYSFDQDPGWPEHFSHQPELLAYAKRSVERNNLADRLRCGIEVASMVWDEDAAQWIMTLRRTDGSSEEELRANFVVGASGLLRIPRFPDIAGLEDFGGPVLHTAQWDPDTDLTRKRIAIIGTGACPPIGSGTASVSSGCSVTPFWTASRSTLIGPIPNAR